MLKIFLFIVIVTLTSDLDKSNVGTIQIGVVEMLWYVSLVITINIIDPVQSCCCNKCVTYLCVWLFGHFLPLLELISIGWTRNLLRGSLLILCRVKLARWRLFRQSGEIENWTATRILPSLCSRILPLSDIIRCYNFATKWTRKISNK